MHSCNRDMRSVGGGLAWDFAGGQNTERSLHDPRCDVQQWKGLQYFHPLPCCFEVSCTGFVEHKLRALLAHRSQFRSSLE